MPSSKRPLPDRPGRNPGRWRVWTARWRVLPSVVLVGAQRAGTTSAMRYLGQHPQLVPALRKEVHFFDDDASYERGEDWYRAYFPTTRELVALERRDGKRRYAFEGTPAYMFVESAAARMGQLIPDAKLVVMVRDPVRRALSNWKLAGEWGGQYGSFELEVEHELARLAGREGPFGTKKARGLLARGHYAEQLERLWRHYPRERTFVGETSNLSRDPAAFCAPLFEFLELEPFTPEVQKVHNRSRDETDMSARTRERLEEYFAPHNERLFELLGRRFDWTR